MESTQARPRSSAPSLGGGGALLRPWHHVPILGDRALPLLGGPEEWLKLLDDHAAGRSHAAFAAHHGAAHHGAAHQVAALER